MQRVENRIVLGSCGKPMSVDITFPDDRSQKYPVVIFSHGFKGFKDWGHFNLIAQKFAKEGFVFLKFNYSHNGVSPENMLDFVDLEAFSANTYSKEVEDLRIMVDYVFNDGELQENVDKTQIYLIGHSKGGGNSILVAGTDNRVKKLCTWASVSRFGRMFDNTHFMGRWKEEGVVFIMNARTKQPMPMSYSFYEDYIANQENLDIRKVATEIEIPWLIIHGSQDFVVTIKEARILAELNPNAQLITNNGDHTFGGAHPWLEENLPPLADQVVDQTIAFFRSAD